MIALLHATCGELVRAAAVYVAIAVFLLWALCSAGARADHRLDDEARPGRGSVTR